MDDDSLSMTPVSDDRASMVPLRRLFGAWSGDRSHNKRNQANPTTPPLRFGAHSKTPKKSNTSRRRPQQIMMKENADPLFALASPPSRRCSSTPSPLVVRHSITNCRDDDDEQAKQRRRRRRHRWKTGLVLADHKTRLTEHPPPPTSNAPSSSVGGGVPHGVLVTNNGSTLCFVRYQGPPRHVRFPVGDDGIWPAGWFQREIAWTDPASPSVLSVDVVWFTPVLQKPLTDLHQVVQFALLLRLYGGDDEERAWRHLISLHEQRPHLPRIVH